MILVTHQLEAWWVRSFSLSYARQLEFLSDGFFEKFGFGFSLKYYQGFGYIATKDISTYLTTNAMVQFPAKQIY